MAEITKEKAIQLLNEAERIVENTVASSRYLSKDAVKRIEEICDLVESLGDSDLSYRAFNLKGNAKNFESRF